MDWLGLVEGIFRDARNSEWHRLIVAGLGGVVSVAVIAGLNGLWRRQVDFSTKRKRAARALREQAEYHTDLRHRHEALELYDLSVQLNPRDGQAYYLRGRLHAELGDPNRAVADWKRCLARLPQHRDARQRLAQMGGPIQPMVPGWAYAFGVAAVILLFALVGIGSR